MGLCDDRKRLWRAVTREKAGYAAMERAFIDAAITPALWHRALQLLADFTHSARGQLVGIGGPAAVPFNWVTDIPQQAVDDFVSMNFASPDVSYRVAATFRTGFGTGKASLLAEDDYDAVIPSLEDGGYRDYCEHYHIPFGIQTNLHVDREGLIGLAVLRTRGDGRSSADDRARFARAVPLAQRAVRIQAALEGQGAALLAGAFDAVGKAAVLIDSRGQVQAVTPRAEALIAPGRWLRLCNRTLSAARADNRDGFDAAVARALRTGKDCSPCVIGSTRPGESPLIVDFVSLPARDWSLGFAPRVAVMIRAPAPPPPDPRLLETLFDLTGAEAEVATLLATGLSRADIADVRGVSTATIVSQIKSIFEKTGASRESLLVARLRDIGG